MASKPLIQQSTDSNNNHISKNSNNNNITNSSNSNNKFSNIINNFNNNNNNYNNVNNHNSNLHSDYNLPINSNTNHTESVGLSVKDRLKMINSASIPNNAIADIKNRLLLNPHANNNSHQPTPIEINHNLHSNLVDVTDNKNNELNSNADIKKADQRAKTKEELEEEKKLKREKMKLKMGNSTNKIIGKNQQADKEKEAQKEKEKSNGPNKIKTLASLLAEKIQINPVQNNFKVLEINKQNRILKFTDEDIQQEEERVVEDEGDESPTFDTNKKEESHQTGQIIKKDLDNKINNSQLPSAIPLQERQDQNKNSCDIININANNVINSKGTDLDTNSKPNDKYDIDNEDFFMKQMDKKPRLMTQVKKFKRPDFKLEN